MNSAPASSVAVRPNPATPTPRETEALEACTKAVKCITTFADEYGNTWMGDFIALCVVERNDSGFVEYKVLKLRP